MKGKPAISPVYLTATYKFDSSDELIDVVQKHEGYIYSRWDNPSVVEFEETLAALEGFDKAVGFCFRHGSHYLSGFCPYSIGKSNCGHAGNLWGHL